MLAPAMEYQINVYSQMGTDAGQPIPAATDPRTLPRQDILIGTPDTIIKRIQRLQTKVPLTELCFWSHPPGIPHEAIMAHLERIAKQIMPAIKNVASASADA